MLLLSNFIIVRADVITVLFIIIYVKEENSRTWRLGATKNLDIIFGGSSLGQRWVNVRSTIGQR